MLVTMTEVVFEVVTLVLQGVEGLVLDTPARTSGAHYLHQVVISYWQVRNPREALLSAVGMLFPVQS